MARAADDAEFWLPPHFLSDDAAVGKVNKVVGGGAVWRSQAEVRLDVPRREFPYEFGFRSEASSPVESVETTESEEDDFFAELTQRLTLSDSRKVSPLDLYTSPPEVKKVSRGSPQSILGGIGSWSGRSSNGSNHSPLQGPSPPATPYEADYDTWGLIRAAAGQVERLKFNAEDQFATAGNVQFRDAANTKPEMIHIPLAQTDKDNFYIDQLKQNYMAAARQAHRAALLREHHLQNLARSVRYSNSRCGVASELSAQSAWQRTQQQQVTMPARANIQAVSVKRKESVGTGVFLPRRYSPAPAAPPRKRPVASNALVPAKVVQALNLSIEEMNAKQQQPHYSAYAASLSQQNYEALMVRRNAFLAQQQRVVARTDEHVQSNLDVCLPQEWSY